MNSFLIDTQVLLSGQSSPCTGVPITLSRSRNATFITYNSGHNAAVQLQMLAPFLTDIYVSFYDFGYPGLNTTGSSPPAFLDSPATTIRAVATGIGNPWCGVIFQN